MKATQSFVEAHRAILAPILGSGDGWDQRLSELEALADLEDDWDGLGAPAPSPELVFSAGSLARLLREGGVLAPSRIASTMDGTPVLEWQAGGGIYLLEVVRPQEGDWTAYPANQPLSEAELAW